MNETIELLLNHRSIRKFTEEPVSDEQFKTMLSAAQMASSSATYKRTASFASPISTGGKSWRHGPEIRPMWKNVRCFSSGVPIWSG